MGTTIIRSILIADDDDSCRETLRDIVEPEGFRALLASSGEEALDIMHARSRSTLALARFADAADDRAGDGFQVVHQINALLPCILVTANASQEIIRKAFQVRVYSVIPKPVSRFLLINTMLRALKAYEDSLSKSEPEQ